MFANVMNFDKFDLIVKVHRFFGLKYYGNYERERSGKLFGYCTNFLRFGDLSL